MRILAIDPGSEQSAWVVYDADVKNIVAFDIEPNLNMIEFAKANIYCADILAIEMIASYGMAVGKSVFETCVWIGRFVQAGGGNWEYVYRKDEKICLCGSMKAKDANIRQAIIDRFGGEEKAIGKKKTPGPLYGIKADVWAALAVAITYAEKGGEA